MPEIRMPENMVPARFLERLNRFVARAAVDGAETLVHVPSSGRMRELLTPGAAIYLQPAAGSGRRTAYTLLLVDYGGTLVSVDSLLPNRLLYHAFRHRALPGFEAYSETRREVAFRDGRIDFLLTGNGDRCLVEVKSVTLVQNGEARFPDAPTQRGARHLRELAHAVGEGCRAAVIFVVQRDDGICFRPNDERDREFGATLRLAHRQGVEALAWSCRVELTRVRLLKPLPVLLDC